LACVRHAHARYSVQQKLSTGSSFCLKLRAFLFLITPPQKELFLTGFLKGKKSAGNSMERLLLLRGRWEELAQAVNYDANKLAELCSISTRQLRRHFHQKFQRSPQNWLNDYRMKAAERMLLAGDPVKKVALELGFKHSSHFCRKFKCQKNMTPHEFVLTQIETCPSRLTNVPVC
jgi:AraC-like DNA-binding protein